MHCDAATVAYRYPGINPKTGKNYEPWKYVSYTDDAHLLKAVADCPPTSEWLLLPCGRCLLCSRRYRLHWALRCQHELRQHDLSCFLTLTVSDDYLAKVFPPASHWQLSCKLLGSGYADYAAIDERNAAKRAYSDAPSLWHKPYQDFIKRLRRALYYRGYHNKLRYFMCGEYGDKSARPHYHAVVFGWRPHDMVPLPFHPGCYTSAMLSKLWPYGYHIVEDVCINNCSYVAGYCDKKLDRRGIDWIRDYGRMPEYVAMSRRPGIGGAFFDRFCDSDLYPMNSDGSFVRLYALLGKDRKVKMPRYYDQLLLLRDPEKYAKLIAARQVAVDESVLDVVEWLNDSHRAHAVALTRRRQREPGVACDI